MSTGMNALDMRCRARCSTSPRLLRNQVSVAPHRLLKTTHHLNVVESIASPSNTSVSVNLDDASVTPASPSSSEGSMQQPSAEASSGSVPPSARARITASKQPGYAKTPRIIKISAEQNIGAAAAFVKRVGHAWEAGACMGCMGGGEGRCRWVVGAARVYAWGGRRGGVDGWREPARWG